MSSREPLAAPSQGSFKLNPNSTGTPQAGPAEVPRAHLPHQSAAKSSWILDQNSSPISPSHNDLLPLLAARDKPTPEEHTFSTIPPAHIRQSNSQRTAQAALDLTDISPKRTDGLSIDPALFALTLGQATRAHQHGLAQSSSVSIFPESTGDSSQDQEEDSSLIDLSVLQSAKRKEISTSPDKEPVAKRPRPANDIAAQLQAPLPPPRAMLPPQGQFHAVTTPSGGVGIRHRVSLPHIHQNNNYQQAPPPAQNHGNVAEVAPMGIPQNFLYLEYLKKQNQHLETQLYNRNYESTRQVDELRRANAYAAQAKRCMRKDGEDINHLRMLMLYAKNKIDIWEQMLRPLAILESPSDTDLDPGMQGSAEGATTRPKSRVPERVADEACEVVKNFEKALREIHSRPVHQLDELVDTYATFDG
ncbi:hypothetical protein TWF696_004427 [Orbilia brochopaga]|uniref:Uncharacterized protein n=1 Tax=Orbilia brochopaga TaxID=3140254 RepID=A0AAV9V9D4_9PEZI